MSQAGTGRVRAERKTLARAVRLLAKLRHFLGSRAARRLAPDIRNALTDAVRSIGSDVAAVRAALVTHASRS